LQIQLYNLMRILAIIFLCIVAGGLMSSFMSTDKSVHINENILTSVNRTNNDDPCHCGGHCLCRPYPNCKRIICW